MTLRRAPALLCECYERQADAYACVSELIEQLSRGLRSDADTGELLANIALSLDQAAALTKDLPALDSLDLTAREQAAVARVRDVLQQLNEQIRETETCAAEARDRLLPQLNDQTQRQRMLRAYHNTST